MKFACPLLDDSLKARIEHHTRLRFSVIDRFMGEQHGASWLQRPRLIRGEPSHFIRKDLWEFALQSNFLMRLNKGGLLNLSQRSDIPDLTVDAFRFETDEYSMCLLGASKLVTDDLATAWHPKFHGRKIFPGGMDFPLAWQQTLKALGLLATFPDFIDLIRSECGAICFIDANPHMEEGQCISLASKMVPGLVYVSSAPHILLAESLVHESAHLRFRAMEEVTEFYVGGQDIRVMTPLRTDPRPISGLIHQLVVLRHLTALYEKFCSSGDPAIDQQRHRVEKRFRLHLQNLDEGKRMVSSVKSALTPDGRKLLDRLLEDSESTLL